MSGRSAVRRRVIAGAVAAVAVVLPASTAAHQSHALSNVTGPVSPAPKPTITPPGGAPFLPTLGDWEGTANGFPASFQLLYDPHSSSYEFKDMVLLQPNGCPVSSWHYSEGLVSPHRLRTLRRDGTYGLTNAGLGGGLTGPHSALLTHSYNAGSGSCSGALKWKLHPAQRRTVQDGTWKLQFADGESKKFTVLAGGRLATSIGLPSELASCRGPSGAVDLFIAANGQARVSQPDVAVSLKFSATSASGEITVPGGSCPRFTMTASLPKH